MRKIRAKINIRHLIFAMIYVATMSALLFFQNCSPVNFTPAPPNALNGNNSPFSTPICQPFQNGTGSGTSQNGILSSISYIPTTSTVITQNGNNLSTASFQPGQQDVQVIPNPVYLNQFSVFTQNFSLGFQTANGSDVDDLNGNELVQYFSLHSQGLIGLAQNSTAGAVTPGSYQFAVLSDDGSVFSIGSNTGSGVTYQPLINNDGNHSNRFSCAQSLVNFSAGAMVPFNLDYYQGPPVRIALMLFWRLIPANNAAAAMADPLCPTGQNGTTEADEYFFGVDPNSGLPVATANYDDPTAGSTAGILNRGWQVVPVGNFFLTGGATNPCQTN